MNYRLITLMLLICAACGKASTPQRPQSTSTETGSNTGTQGAAKTDPHHFADLDPNAQAFFGFPPAQTGSVTAYNLAVADSSAMSCGVLGRAAAPKGGTVYVVTLQSQWLPSEVAADVPADAYQLGTRQNPKDPNVTTTMTAQQVTLDDNCTATWKVPSQASLVMDSNSNGTLTVVSDTNQTLTMPYKASLMEDVAWPSDVWPTNPNAKQPASVQAQAIPNPSVVAKESSTALPNSYQSPDQLQLQFRDAALTCDPNGGAATGAAHGGGEFVIVVSSGNDAAVEVGNHVALTGTYTLYDDSCTAHSTPITGGVVSISKYVDASQGAAAHVEGTAVLLVGSQKVSMPFASDLR